MSLLTTAGIPIGLGILAFLGLLIAPGSFLVHPEFEVEVSGLVSDEPPVKMITVSNTGWVQAKNVIVSIHGNWIVDAADTSCPEGVDSFTSQGQGQV